MCRRVTPDYAADLFVPILDRGRNAKEWEISSSTMYSVHVSTLFFIIIITIQMLLKVELAKQFGEYVRKDERFELAMEPR